MTERNKQNREGKEYKPIGYRKDRKKAREERTEKKGQRKNGQRRKNRGKRDIAERTEKKAST